MLASCAEPVSRVARRCGFQDTVAPVDAVSRPVRHEPVAIPRGSLRGKPLDPLALWLNANGGASADRSLAGFARLDAAERGDGVPCVCTPPPLLLRTTLSPRLSKIPVVYWTRPNDPVVDDDVPRDNELRRVAGDDRRISDRLVREGTVADRRGDRAGGAIGPESVRRVADNGRAGDRHRAEGGRKPHEPEALRGVVARSDVVGAHRRRRRRRPGTRVDAVELVDENTESRSTPRAVEERGATQVVDAGRVLNDDVDDAGNAHTPSWPLSLM